MTVDPSDRRDSHNADRTAHPVTPSTSGTPRWNPPWSIWAVIAAGLFVILLVQITDITADHAITNVATAVAVFLSLMSWVLWFCLYSDQPRWLRMMPLLVIVISITIFFAFYRIDHVSGELVPTFARRFSFHPDQLLPLPAQAEPATATEIADLKRRTPFDFPQFLGPHRTASVDTIQLANNWDETAPQQIWKRPIGAGWSAFSAVNGYAVTMEQRGPFELTACYNLQTGKILWSHSTEARYQNKLGGIGPRSTPTIHDGMVYSLGVTGKLHCLDGASGQTVWQKDLPNAFGITSAEDAENVDYGRSNSPLVFGTSVIIPAGGSQSEGVYSLVAYDLKTGEERWRGGDAQISYSSPSLVELCGQKQILIVNEESVSSHDPLTGETLWSHPWPGSNLANSNSSQAVAIDGDKVLLSKGYGTGAMLLQITRNDRSQWKAEEIWKKHNVLRTKFANVVIRGPYTFGLSDGILQCVETKSGRVRWKKGRYGHGQILLVGDKILVLAEDGKVHLVAADPKRHQELGSFQAIEGTSWNNICLYGPFLLVRNSQEAACYRLPTKGETAE